MGHPLRQILKRFAALRHSTLVFILLAFAVPVSAQTTSVTGTVTDTNGLPYAGATLKAQLVLAGAGVNGQPTVTVSNAQQCTSSGFGSAPCKVPFQGTVGPITLDTNGRFSLSLQDNALVTPAGTQWLFSVTISPGVAPPLGTGPQSCSTTLTITGASQSISSSLQSCPRLSNSAGAIPNTPLPISTSGPGPVFNVVNYGAKRNARSNIGVFINGNPQFTCATCNFTQADVGLFISSQNILVGTTIASVQNATTATTVGSPIASNTGPFVYGTNDDVAVKAAVADALAQVCVAGGQRTGNTCIPSAAPIVYFPTGGYLLCNFGSTSGLINIGSTKGFGIVGDGRDETFIYSCLTAIGPPSNFGAFLSVASGADSVVWQGMTLDGVTGGPGTGQVALIGGGIHIKDVHVQRWRITGVQFNGGPIVVADHLIVDNNSGVAGIFCFGCSGIDFYSSSASNNACPNILIQNSVGLNTSSGFKWYGGLIDECGGGASIQLTNAQDVWFIGASAFSGGGAGGAYTVDGTSFLHLDGGIAAVFGNDSNASGLVVNAGGVVQASDVRFGGTGTGKCINNLGIFNDNGGNSCENMFPIASGTSTGTTAVLTLTNVGAAVNVNCSVGDALVVEGASPAGYNGYYPAGATSGITAVTATTLTYTTLGSNMGAAATVGVAFCRNLQSYTGNLPKALLNNPVPNTCYVTITPILNATNYLLCNFRTESATNITRITASSQVVTACATAPIITISDGTATQTLTLTTAKQQWDSAVDTSSGVGTTIFKPNGTITVRYDVGLLSNCGTPPTQLAISYNISPIMSN